MKVWSGLTMGSMVGGLVAVISACSAGGAETATSGDAITAGGTQTEVNQVIGRACVSQTLDGAHVAEGTCVQDSDPGHAWFKCVGKSDDDWIALPRGPNRSCSAVIALDDPAAGCVSDTLGGKIVPPGTCVQDSDGDHPWFRCNGAAGDRDWDTLPGGPDDSCSTSIAFDEGKCISDTLGGRTVPVGACVQDSQFPHFFFRCDGKHERDWADLPGGKADGTCTQKFPFERRRR